MTAQGRFEVPPARLGRWLDRWVQGNGPVRRTVAAGDAVRFEAAAAGLLAEPPFPPVATGAWEGFAPAVLLEHVARDRTVGVLLVRLGGYAAGVFEGDRLVASKTGSRLVHGRHRAGGSSARRFERRRAGQARSALNAAADVAARVLVGAPLEAVVFGGDRRALDELRDDPRLAPLFAIAVERFLGDVPDPRRDVLEASPERFLATVLTTPEPGRAAGP